MAKWKFRAQVTIFGTFSKLAKNRKTVTKKRHDENGTEWGRIEKQNKTLHDTLCLMCFFLSLHNKLQYNCFLVILRCKNIVLFCIVLHCVVLCCIVFYAIVPYWIAWERADARLKRKKPNSSVTNDAIWHCKVMTF